MGPGGGPGGVVFATCKRAFQGIFSLFFLPVRIGWILGSRPPEIELRTEAQSPSSVNCNECIPKKNRHSESVPGIHSLCNQGLQKNDVMVLGELQGKKGAYTHLEVT